MGVIKYIVKEHLVVYKPFVTGVELLILEDCLEWHSLVTTLCSFIDQNLGLYQVHVKQWLSQFIIISNDCKNTHLDIIDNIMSWSMSL